MKTGKSLEVLAQEITRQNDAKHDYIADTRQLELKVLEPPPTQHAYGFRVNGHGTFEPNQIFHEQVAYRLGIPKTYYDRLKQESPFLLATNVNHWLKEQPQKRLIRTLDNRARAFLSDRFRPLDNYDLAGTVLDKIAEAGASVASCELTERRLYIKAVFPKLEAEITVGDVVQSGLVISNSEVGCGSVRVEPLLFRLSCSNGLIVADASLKKFHIGRAGDLEDDGAREFYKDDTRKLDDAAFFSKVRDIVDATLEKSKFDAIINRARATAKVETEAGPVEVVAGLTNRFGLSEDEHKGVLRHLVRGGDLTQWGAVNAITRTSQDVADYDRATDLERLGGEVLELTPQDWERIARDFAKKNPVRR